jgi:hypothetical protein
VAQTLDCGGVVGTISVAGDANGFGKGKLTVGSWHRVVAFHGIIVL